LLKPTACLMNVASGGFMDEAALIATLEAERIASAGLNITAGAFASGAKILDLAQCGAETRIRRSRPATMS
jgi:lactate dehydrogenase-like 2-hydroxyacid dehydrogenase